MAEEKIATREAYGEALVELGEKNRNIVVLDADLAKSTNTIKFAKKFPERFFDMGVAEQNMIATAAGLGVSGKIAFASTFAVFATGRAYDQIRVAVAYSDANVKIAGSHAGIITGEDGVSHQATEDIALMRAMPRMRVLCPADGSETHGCVMAAANSAGPFYLRLCRMKTKVIFGRDYEFRVGKGVVLRDGADACIIATGAEVAEALLAADELKKKKIDAGVVDMASLKPLDEALVLKMAKKTGAIATAEDHSTTGGLGGAVAEVLAENCVARLERIGLRDVFAESGSPEELMKKYGIDATGIAKAVEYIVKKK